ncbi:hypothetical protein ABTD28_20055, partial [Acinetobacter baumannii]
PWFFRDAPAIVEGLFSSYPALVLFLSIHTPIVRSEQNVHFAHPLIAIVPFAGSGWKCPQPPLSFLPRIACVEFADGYSSIHP